MTKFPNKSEVELSELVAVFHQFKNPGAAWAAFHLATTQGLPIPALVAAEIARFAARVAEPLLSAWNGDKYVTLTETDIGAAWGIRPGTEFAQSLRKGRRSAEIAFEYSKLLNDKMSPTVAKQAIAEKFNLSVKSIENALTAARKTLDEFTPKF